MTNTDQETNKDGVFTSQSLQVGSLCGDQKPKQNELINSFSSRYGFGHQKLV